LIVPALASDQATFRRRRAGAGIGKALEQLQEKWTPLFRPELRKAKESRSIRDSIKS
jgi:hypothetical protein